MVVTAPSEAQLQIPSRKPRPYPSLSFSLQQDNPLYRLAAIDVGTNSIHMVVAEINPALPAFNIIDTEKSTVRLGERYRKTGNLTDEAMGRSLSALRRCQEIAHSCKVDQIIAVATSAVREAPNGQAFIQQVEAELGLSINLISGEEEARRIFLGVLSGMEFQNHPHAIIDIGGGSTELILGDSHGPRSLSSTKVGAVRLSDEFLTTDPISLREFERLQAYARGMLEWRVEELRSHIRPGEELQLVGTSGTIESLIRIHASEALGTNPTSLHGYELTLGELKQLTHRLRKMSYAERCQVPGMSERRAEIIVAGAVILQEAMSLLQIPRITACERALREGVIVDWMLNHGLIEDRLRFQGSVRQRSAINLAHKYHVDLASAERIADFAVSLFDQTQNTLHAWTDEERQLLWAAGLLHNCGHYVAHSAHHKHSYYLVRHGGLLGYTDVEVEIVANLSRYHRKGAPKKKHVNYQNLTHKTDRQIVDQLSAILKLATALDRRQIGAVDSVRCDYQPQDRKITLHLRPASPEVDCAIELWSLEYKKACFEAEFGVALTATVEGI